jgi:hypothetical protein
LDLGTESPGTVCWNSKNKNCCGIVCLPCWEKKRDQECVQRIQNCHHTACKEIVHSTLRSWQTSRNDVLTASGSTPVTRWVVQCHCLLLQDLLGSVWHVEIISVPNILISFTLHNAGKTEIFKYYNLALRRNPIRATCCRE